MKVPGDQLTGFPDLPQLLDGLPDMEITRHSRIMTDAEFDRQRQKVADRNSNANIIGAILQDNDLNIGLVCRRGDHPGWTLPSGSVESGENFATAFPREMEEELGVTLLAGSTTLLQVVERTFYRRNMESGDMQQVFLAKFAARVAMGQRIHQTIHATNERLTVGTFVLSPSFYRPTFRRPVPRRLAFPPDSAVISSVRQRLATKTLFSD